MLSETTRLDILEAMPDASMAVGQNGRTMLVHRQRERLTGYERGDVPIRLSRIDTGDLLLDRGGA